MRSFGLFLGWGGAQPAQVHVLLVSVGVCLLSLVDTGKWFLRGFGFGFKTDIEILVSTNG